jgi:GNAT superfamily N-acetyltransferase
VREDFQRMGMARFLLDRLEEIAVRNGYRGFRAQVLRENEAMRRAFQEKYPHAALTRHGDGDRLRMDFLSGLR